MVSSLVAKHRAKPAPLQPARRTSRVLDHRPPQARYPGTSTLGPGTSTIVTRNWSVAGSIGRHFARPGTLLQAVSLANSCPNSSDDFPDTKGGLFPQDDVHARRTKQRAPSSWRPSTQPAATTGRGTVLSCRLPRLWPCRHRWSMRHSYRCRWCLGEPNTHSMLRWPATASRIESGRRLRCLQSA